MGGQTSRVLAADPTQPLRVGWQRSPIGYALNGADFFLTADDRPCTAAPSDPACLLGDWKSSNAATSVSWFEWACHARKNPDGSDVAGNVDATFRCPINGIPCASAAACDDQTKKAVEYWLADDDIRSLDGMYIDWEVQDGHSAKLTLEYLAGKIKAQGHPDPANPSASIRLKAGLWTNPAVRGGIDGAPLNNKNGLTGAEGDLFDFVTVMLNHPGQDAPGHNVDKTKWLNDQLEFWDGTSAKKVLIFELLQATCADAKVALTFAGQFGDQPKVNKIVVWLNGAKWADPNDAQYSQYQKVLYRLGLAPNSAYRCVGDA
ncbi:MAG: hypothetical protein QOH61_1673 [Chloroflexota bacterium]|nr:hypothetical protein [Chloroflexota bacterium]